jgi:hypothetical protein
MIKTDKTCMQEYIWHVEETAKTSEKREDRVQTKLICQILERKSIPLL